MVKKLVNISELIKKLNIFTLGKHPEFEETENNYKRTNTPLRSSFEYVLIELVNEERILLHIHWRDPSSLLCTVPGDPRQPRPPFSQ